MGTPSIPQGTRDFSAETVYKRNYIFSSIRRVFQLYGFEPLETPAMENLDTLMGKYGEEGDKLIFKILNNGINDPKNIEKSKAGFEKVLEGKNSSDLTERALKYDLTIPFARYVAMNHGKLTFPLRRYQIQPVWRADRPQKGRYREFTQCDADIVGNTSKFEEAELANIYASAFSNLGIAVTIQVNNRKILTGIAEMMGAPERITDITVAIDKTDKIGIEGVNNELLKLQFSEESIALLNQVVYSGSSVQPNEKGYNQSRLDFIKQTGGYAQSAAMQAGVSELSAFFELTDALGLDNIKIDFTLARGLNYYTGIIFEVKAAGVQMGSIGGGGRYDDLTGLFGVPGIPGVGISFGVDRIYDVMEELKLFPANIGQSTQLLFFNMGDAESRIAFQQMQLLRSKGIACELYPEFKKINKQFGYAEKKNIPFIAIIGSKEMEQNTCLVKNLATGLQDEVRFDQLFNYLNT